MVKIAIGSTSKAKIDILKNCMKSMIGEEFEVFAFDVDSEIPDQPLDEDTTIQGSINRAKNALKKMENVDFAVGLEGGLHEIDNKGYFLICSAAIVDREGYVSVGIGGKLQLPKGVSNGVKEGRQFGELIRQYEEQHKNDKNVLPLVQALISRKEAFDQAVKNAYLSYQNRKHF